MRGLILCGGYGSRFFPVTKVVPKELLPLIDRPSLDFIVEEMYEAGIREILVVSSRRKAGLFANYYDRDIELERYVSDAKKVLKFKSMEREGLKIYFIRQKEMLGTGDAVLLGKGFLRGAFILAFPDDIVFTKGSSLSKQLIEAHELTGKSVLAVKDMRGEDVSRYGVIEALGGLADKGLADKGLADKGLENEGVEIVLTKGIVEKPPKGSEPSSYVSIGRYLLKEEIFEVLERGLSKHKGEGEYYLTTAINELSQAGGVVSCIFRGDLYDTGQPLGYIKAMTQYGLMREDIKEEYIRFLENALEQIKGR